MKKNNDNYPIHVQFLLDDENTVYAYFPTVKHNDTFNTCYSHVGQHSGCDKEYAKQSLPATPEQYKDLKEELESIGYNLIVVNPVKKGDNITIIGRRWFDRVNGNTYFSAVGIVNGLQVVNIDFEYGYGNHYEDRIFSKLIGAGYCPDVEKYSNGGKEAFWNYCDRKGIIKYVTHSDVNRKKDL